MKAMRPLIIVIALTALSACATSGNGEAKKLSTRSAGQLLTTGKTSKDEVLLALGMGASLRFESGYEVWVYEFASGAPRFVDYLPIVGQVTRRMPRTRKELRILFDPQGVVWKYLLLDIAEEARVAHDPDAAASSAH